MHGDHQRKHDDRRSLFSPRPMASRRSSASPAASASVATPATAATPMIEGEDLAEIVGRNLRRLRTQRGYSLSRLAEASGVSRAMLSQIELARSVPSIGLLWKVARALDVPFAAFTVDAQAEGTAVIRAADAKVLMSPDGRFASRSLFPADVHRRVEFYHLRLAPGGIEVASPHPIGTIENLVVDSGSIEVDIADKRHWLTAGDAILFEADVAHSYRNTGDCESFMYLVIVYSDLASGK